MPSSSTDLRFMVVLYIFRRSCAMSMMPALPATSLWQWFCQRAAPTRYRCPRSCQCSRLPVSKYWKTAGCHQMSTSRSCQWMIAAVMYTASYGPSTLTLRAHTCYSDPLANTPSVSAQPSYSVFSVSPLLTSLIGNRRAINVCSCFMRQGYFMCRRLFRGVRTINNVNWLMWMCITPEQMSSI